MKLYLILAIACSALTAQAQTTPTVTDQIDKGLNKAADKLIEGLFKEAKKTDNSKKTPETKPETETTSPEGETLKGLGKMLGGMGFDAKEKEPVSSGLSNIRMRTEMLGGYATIESYPGTGTTISVEIPLKSIHSI